MADIVKTIGTYIVASTSFSDWEVKEGYQEGCN
jgi:hypothetical protein